MLILSAAATCLSPRTQELQTPAEFHFSSFCDDFPATLLNSPDLLSQLSLPAMSESGGMTLPAQRAPKHVIQSDRQESGPRAALPSR